MSMVGARHDSVVNHAV